MLPIYSVNYDFVPMDMTSEKCLWLDMAIPPPPDLKIGDVVRIESSNKHFVPPNTLLSVKDIVGVRVILNTRTSLVSTAQVPFFESKNDRSLTDRWQPYNHSYQWGYATKNVETAPRYRNWTFGKGEPVAYLVY